MQKLSFISENVSKIPCSNCGGKVQEFSVPNPVWNAIVRKNGKETDKEYLCVWCFTSCVVEWFDGIKSLLTQRAVDLACTCANEKPYLLGRFCKVCGGFQSPSH
jgi:hypothetical protein